MPAKIIVRRGKKQFIKELGREVAVVKPREHLLRDISRDFSTHEGLLASGSLAAKDGSIIKTEKTGKEFIIFTARFIDLYKRMRRLPQTMPLKDLGVVAAETGVGKDSLVVDAGAGSGATAAFFAHLCKMVVSYEIRDDHADLAEQNWKVLGLKNVTLKRRSIYGGIEEKDIDLVTLDVPEPWNAIQGAAKALKVGGWLVSYSPSVPQVMDFCAAVRKEACFELRKTIEVIERHWEIDERRVRPKSIEIGHSGFMTFARKILS